MSAEPKAQDAPAFGFGRLLHDVVHKRRRYRQFLGWLFVFSVTLLGKPTMMGMYVPGVVVVVLGMSMRMWASGFVRKNTVLATNGPYAFVRHPLYTGNVLIAIGFALASGLWWSFPVGLVFILLFYPHSIAYEDRKLNGLFPDRWEPWAKKTPAIVPNFFKPRDEASKEKWSWSFKQSLFANGEPIYVLVMSGCLWWLWHVMTRA